MELLFQRVESIDHPSWFLQYLRPDTLPPLEIPAGNPYLPYTIIAVATAAEAEVTFYDRIRNSAAYCAAFGLQTVVQPLSNHPGVRRGQVDGFANPRIVDMTTLRSSRYLWKCASTTRFRARCSHRYAPLLHHATVSVSVVDNLQVHIFAIG